ncbi:MAG: spore coat protein [Bacillota bacterium]|jgi:spore coat protein CotF|nr:spore coat protein [Bacillota bacterium]HHU29605.1 spore coat protein [Bacillota bacterium]
MQDKDMVNDVLSMLNASLTNYTTAIAESCNQQLRQTLTQIRNADEQFQFQLSQKAEQKGYYKPAIQADKSVIEQYKSQLSGS